MDIPRDVPKSGDRELACTFLQTLVDVTFVLSSERFQRTVWVFGNHPERYVSSYEETLAMFDDNLGWLIEDDFWKQVPLPSAQIQALKELSGALDAFHETLRSRDPAEIVSHPRWRIVTALAGTTLALLADNPCKAVPSIAD